MYNDYEFPVGKEYEDTAVTPFILNDAKRIKYIPYPMYYYLQREKSIVASNTLMSAFYKICNNISEVLNSKNNNFDKYKYIINEFFVDRIYEIFIQDYNQNRQDFKENIEKFYTYNKDIVIYIVESNMVNKYENHYSEKQKCIVKDFFMELLNEDYKKIEKKLFRIKVKNYLSRIKVNFKNFIKALINK